MQKYSAFDPKTSLLFLARTAHFLDPVCNTTQSFHLTALTRKLLLPEKKKVLLSLELIADI